MKSDKQYLIKILDVNKNNTEMVQYLFICKDLFYKLASVPFTAGAFIPSVFPYMRLTKERLLYT